MLNSLVLSVFKVGVTKLCFVRLRERKITGSFFATRDCVSIWTMDHSRGTHEIEAYEILRKLYGMCMFSWELKTIFQFFHLAIYLVVQAMRRDRNETSTIGNNELKVIRSCMQSDVEPAIKALGSIQNPSGVYSFKCKGCNVNTCWGVDRCSVTTSDMISHVFNLSGLISLRKTRKRIK